MMAKGLSVVIVVVAAIVLLLGFIFWFMSGGAYLFLPGSPNLPGSLRPGITHGEFPFRLVYEIDGETFEVEDTLICDFNGFGANAARTGKFRQWKSHLKSGNTRITLLVVDGIEIFYTPGLPSSRIAGVYMGDKDEYPGSNKSTFPDAWYTSDFENKNVNEYIISAEDMWQKYNLKILSWEPSSPIQNNFK